MLEQQFFQLTGPDRKSIDLSAIVNTGTVFEGTEDNYFEGISGACASSGGDW